MLDTDDGVGAKHGGLLLQVGGEVGGREDSSFGLVILEGKGDAGRKDFHV